MQPAMAVDAAPNPGIIFETLLAHQRSAALRTAIELDVFRAVGEGPADAATLATRCSTSQRGMRILCDFLTIIGLLAKQDGVYSHTPTSAMFLDPRSPTSLHATARFLGLAEMRTTYDELTEIVRSGRTSLPGGQCGAGQPDLGGFRAWDGAHDGAADRTAGRHRIARAHGSDAGSGYRRRARPVRD